MSAIAMNTPAAKAFATPITFASVLQLTDQVGIRPVSSACKKVTIMKRTLRTNIKVL